MEDRDGTEKVTITTVLPWSIPTVPLPSRSTSLLAELKSQSHRPALVNSDRDLLSVHQRRERKKSQSHRPALVNSDIRMRSTVTVPVLMVSHNPTVLPWSIPTEIHDNHSYYACRVTIPPSCPGQFRLSPLQAPSFEALKGPSAVTPFWRTFRRSEFAPARRLPATVSVLSSCISALRRYLPSFWAKRAWHDSFLEPGGKTASEAPG